MIVTTKQLFAHAYGKYAIGAYNINNLEQTMGLFEGNVRSKAPFIVQLSKGARSYTHKLMLEAMMKTADEIFPEAVFAVHLDHGDEKTCMDCIASGVYSSVMIDASAFPYEQNVEITKRVVDAAHAKGIVVEAELGQLKGVEEDVTAAEHVYTKPEEVVDFVSKTGCDSLACAIGTSHGAFKFSGDQKLRYDILEEIQKKLPASRSSCTAPPRCPRGRSPASTPPAAPSRAPRASTRRSSSARPSAASRRSTSTPTAASSGRACTASSSATSRRSSTCATRARSS